MLFSEKKKNTSVLAYPGPGADLGGTDAPPPFLRIRPSADPKGPSFFLTNLRYPFSADGRTLNFF